MSKTPRKKGATSSRVAEAPQSSESDAPSSQSDAPSSQSESRKRARSGTIVARAGRSRAPSRPQPPKRARKTQTAVLSDDDDDISQDEEDNPSTGSVPSSADDNDEDRSMDIDDDASAGETIEQARAALARRKKKWTSKVYDHFEDEPRLRLNPKTQVYDTVFVCIFDPTVTVTRCPTDTGTSNLKRHMDHCAADPDASHQTTLDDWRSSYSKGKHRLYWVEEVSVHHRPFLLAGDPPLVNMQEMLRPNTSCPNPAMVTRDLHDVYTLTRTHIQEELAANDFAKHLVFDGWASASRRSFTGIGAAFFNGEKIVFRHLDLVPLTSVHSASYLARKTVTTTDFFAISNDLLGMVGDNHNVNPRMVDTMATQLLPSDTMVGVDTFVGCADHQVDLSVRAGVSLITGKKEMQGVSDFRNGDDDDESATLLAEINDIPDLEDLAYMDNVDLETQQEELEQWEQVLAEVEEVKDLSEEELAIGISAATKVLRLGRRVYNNGFMQDRLKDICETLTMRVELMVRAVVTRWVSLRPVFQRAVYLELPLRELVNEAVFNKDKKRMLKKYQLSSTETRVLKEVGELLELAELAIKHMSRTEVSLIWHVIPVYDVYIDELDAKLLDHSLLKVTRAVAARMRTVALKYYSKTDDNRVMRIAMIMVPFYKTGYFVDHGWEAEWIAIALDLVRHEWQNRYKKGITANTPSTNNVDTASTTRNRFAEIASKSYGTSSHGSDALECYLETPALSSAVDPIAYWAASLDKPDRHGVIVRTGMGQLSKMALDYLSIPATSVDIERMFSHAGQTVTPRRQNLSEETTRELVMTGRWFSSGVVPRDAAVNILDSKQSRKGKGKAKAD
ncbi:hypothetical protein CYLTODRAFT_460015 [Cylindrobasidium torrendii FP15055 ss-10]|uniref:HAT C-terminal dimerisation domain-containing protein n=1 Tax=Cylindrobasidium torrendii FP15055 ss-10 TaxID=1314674 RepID=A0A0D7AVF8_9AGAR|nr:hypothetical protein CYLTODRAFT_460015 [Cylindrobasidium torrendii FP15055 ss-10]